MLWEEELEAKRLEDDKDRERRVRSWCLPFDESFTFYR